METFRLLLIIAVIVSAIIFFLVLVSCIRFFKKDIKNFFKKYFNLYNIMSQLLIFICAVGTGLYLLYILIKDSIKNFNTKIKKIFQGKKFLPFVLWKILWFYIFLFFCYILVSFIKLFKKIKNSFFIKLIDAILLILFFEMSVRFWRSITVPDLRIGPIDDWPRGTF